MHLFVDVANSFLVGSRVVFTSGCSCTIIGTKLNFTKRILQILDLFVDEVDIGGVAQNIFLVFGGALV